MTTHLHVETTGTGEPVLLLHSSGLSGRQWRLLAAELVARGYRAVVPDLTGHGQSEPWPEPRPFSFRIDVDHIAMILRDLGSAHVIAHSYGGLIALHAACAERQAVRSLQVFDPVAFGLLDPIADRDARQMLIDLDLRYTDSESWLTRFVEFWGGPGAWRELREPIRAEFRRVAWIVNAAVQSLMADRTPVDSYRQLRVPVHVMTGEASPLPARRVDERLVDAIAGARLDVIAGAGHLAPVTHPGAFNRLVLETLADLVRYP